LVDNYEEVVANVKQFQKDLEDGTYMIGKLSQFKEWFFLPELDAFGPSKYIGYKEMDAVFYNKGHRTLEQKQIGSDPLDGGASTNKLKNWFRELEKDELLFKELFKKIISFFTTYDKKPNKALQIFVPKNFNKLT